MTQQRVSTPSVIDIRDEVILSANAYGPPSPHLGIVVGDPWDSVLAALAPFALDPATVIPAIGNSGDAPNAGNPFVTRSFLEKRLGSRGFKLIGPVGSGADYEGSTDAIFTTAIGAEGVNGGWLVVLPGTYTFSTSVTLTGGIRLTGQHPSLVTVTSTGNFPAFVLSGAKSSLENLSVEGPSLLSQPLVRVPGERAVVLQCNLQNFPLLGVQLQGARSKVVACRINSSSATATGVWLQGPQQTVENTSFSGTLPQGALRFESNECGAFGNFFDSSLTGFSFYLGSSSLSDNRLVANHYGSSPSLTASLDDGTDTVRYGNTPNTLLANQNNFLIPLQQYTGQPTLTSNQMVLSNSFTHTPGVDDDAVEIWSGIDLFIQRSYEERNFFFTSADPTYLPDGTPSSGVFGWTGSTRTLVWPAFTLRTSHRLGSWTVAAGSQVIAPGEVLYLDLDQSLAGVDIPLSPLIATSPLALTDPGDAQRVVLCVGLPGTFALWLSGFRLLSALDYFDVDGWPLPLTRFIGVTETRNPAPPFSGFAGNTAASLTEKAGAQSALLRGLFEGTNVSYGRVTSDAQFTSDPSPGNYLDGTVLGNGIPAAPTHIVQLQGTAYGLDPTTGLYRFQRESDAWTLVAGNPGGAGPYTALSQLGTGLALLRTNGQVVHYNPNAVGGYTWAQFTPTMAAALTASLPFASTDPVTGVDGGQMDLSLQTSDYTLFTTLNRRTIRYYQEENRLDEIPRTWTEVPNRSTLLVSHPKDSGYNLEQDPTTLQLTGGNGGFSTLSGLPLSKFFSGRLLVGTATQERFTNGFATVNWENFITENFSFHQPNGAFLLVTKYIATGAWYVLGGGPGEASLFSVLPTTDPIFTNFSPHFWLLHAGSQTVTILGATTTAQFSVVRGQFSSGVFTWTQQTLGGANSCSGAVGVIDLYGPDADGTQDIVALVSDPSRSNRPTWWRRAHTTGLWTQSTLTNAPGGGTDVAVSGAVVNSFTYSAASDNLPGYGVASPGGIQFLVRDGSRGSRPTMFRWTRASLTFTSVRLSEGVADVTLTAADTNAISKGWGGFYHPTFKAVQFFGASTAGQFRMFTLFEDIAGLGTWDGTSVGTGGTYLNTTNLGSFTFARRSGSVATRTFGDSFLGPSSVQEDVYVATPTGGVLRGLFTGGTSSFTAQTWTIFNRRASTTDPIVYSNTPTNSYQPTLGVSRGGDLSLQLGSRIETSLPLHGTASLTPSLSYDGPMWFEPGTVIRNITSSVWVGLNRGGYLWISNGALSSRQTEYVRNAVATRGDVTVTNLGTTDDFDWAFDGTQSKIIIVFRDQLNSSYLAAVIYDLATGAITHERAGDFPFVGAWVVPLASTPRVAYNAFIDSWDIVAQDDSRSGGQFVFYRRPTGSSAWTGERVGSGGDKPLATMIANAGRVPAKPYVQANGDVLVATQNGTVTPNLHIGVRLQATTAWTLAYQTTSGGGFRDPELAVTLDGARYWVLGCTDGTIARVAISSVGNSSWSSFTNPLQTSYNRAQKGAVLTKTSSLVFASPLAVDGAIPSAQEMGVFTFNNNNTVVTSAFTARGRLQATLYSGEEETTYIKPSWTYLGDLLYGATRPGRSSPHWSLRGSVSSWASTVGESLLGSGRALTIGQTHVREHWVGEPQQSLVVTIAGDNSLTLWSHLPLAQRERQDQYLSLLWQFPAMGAAGPIFFHGNPSLGQVAEPSLASGQMAIASSRLWPRIRGTTLTRTTYSSGASVFNSGGVLRLGPPTGVTEAAYFGVSLIASGLFKLNPLPALTLVGTHVIFAPTSSTKTYTIVGPVTFLLDPVGASGQHLVLEFYTPSTLKLDTGASPLSYWLTVGASLDRYPLVLGEIRLNHVVLYPIITSDACRVALTHGHLEPRELAGVSEAEWVYSSPIQGQWSRGISGSPSGQVGPFEEILVDVISANKVKIRLVGSLHGVQSLDFTSATPRQLLLRGSLPTGASYLFQREGVAQSQGPSGVQSEILNELVSKLGSTISW